MMNLVVANFLYHFFWPIFSPQFFSFFNSESNQLYNTKGVVHTPCRRRRREGRKRRQEEEEEEEEEEEVC